MKLGIFGGSFNPPHNGHINAAENFYKSIPLDLLLIVPSKKPVHKELLGNASTDDRLEMTRLAFSRSDINTCIYEGELRRETPSYSIETLKALKNEYPKDELYLYVGDDMFLSFETWKDYKEIFSLCTVFVMTRGERVSALFDKKRELENETPCKIIISEKEPFIVSSTQIREEIARKNFDLEIPARVLEYIKEKRLYRQDTEEK